MTTAQGRFYLAGRSYSLIPPLVGPSNGVRDLPSLLPRPGDFPSLRKALLAKAGLRLIRKTQLTSLEDTNA